MKTYDGPISDHFDGEQFFDVDGMPPKKLSEVLRWQFGERNRASLAGMGEERARRHAAAARRGQEGALLIRWACKLADPDRGAQHPDRPRVVDAGFPREFCGTEAAQ